jgi:putative sigma-54 modulation protein
MMDITIHGHNVTVTDALENYARKKLDKLDRYLPNIAEIRVDLTHEHTKRGEDLVSAQVTVRHKRGAILRTEERTTGDILVAVNGAVDNMHRQIQRFKGKRSRKGRERFSATLEELNIAEAIPDVEEYAEEATSEPQQPEIVRRKEVVVEAMNEEEAIEQMELLGHNFFAFFNADSGSINILYKRTSGGYGVLIPRVE